MIKKYFGKTLAYGFLTVIAFVSLFPFYWMIVGATNTSTEITKGTMWFGSNFLVNISKLAETADIATIMWNTFKVAGTTTVLCLLITSMAAYGFQVYQSKIRERIFKVLLLSMMVPFAALMIPLFKITVMLKLLDTHLAIILPYVAYMFFIFFFRQNFKSLLTRIIEAARIDGAGEFAIFFKIIAPTMKSTYAAAAIYSFTMSWNNYLWPLIVLQSDNNKVITLVISSMASAYFPDYGVIMCGIIAATVPMLFVFFALQKHFVAGMLGSVK